MLVIHRPPKLSQMPTHPPKHMPDEWYAFRVGLDRIGDGFRYLELKCLLGW